MMTCEPEEEQSAQGQRSHSPPELHPTPNRPNPFPYPYLCRPQGPDDSGVMFFFSIRSCSRLLVSGARGIWVHSTVKAGKQLSLTSSGPTVGTRPYRAYSRSIHCMHLQTSTSKSTMQLVRVLRTHTLAGNSATAPSFFSAFVRDVRIWVPL